MSEIDGVHVHLTEKEALIAFWAFFNQGSDLLDAGKPETAKMHWDLASKVGSALEDSLSGHESQTGWDDA